MADAVYEQGRLDEAEKLTRTSEEAAASDDFMSQAMWRCVRAKVLAERGEFEQAEDLAREGVLIVDRTDWINDRAEVRMCLAKVLQLANRPAEAAGVVREALDLFEQKRNIASAAQATNLLRRLRKS
jgi:hypothetical protein